jgi:hypothetical protein
MIAPQIPAASAQLAPMAAGTVLKPNQPMMIPKTTPKDPPSIKFFSIVVFQVH